MNRIPKPKKGTRVPKPDGELEKILSLASDPLPPRGSYGRAMARVRKSNANGASPMPFKPIEPVVSPAWKQMIPQIGALTALAASLAIGFYAGTSGAILDLLPPNLIGEDLALTQTLDEMLSGVEPGEDLNTTDQRSDG